MPIGRRLVRFAEYVSVSAAVVGAIATLTTQQPAYAVAPLTVSAALSLIDRQQRSQQLDKTIQATSQKIQDFTASTQQLEQRLHTVEPLLHRQEEVESLVSAITQQNTQIRSEAKTMAQAIESLSSDLRNQTKVQTDTALAGMRSALDDLSSQIALTQNLQNAQTEAQQQSDARQIAIATSVSQLENQIEGRVSGLLADIESFRTDLEAITLQLSEQTTILETLAVETTEDQHEPDFSHVIPQLPTSDDFDLDINLGIDFGTGYTKVCLRDLALEQAEVVTFAPPTDSRLDLDQTLMPTRLAILEDGTLLTGLTVAEWRACDRPIRQNIDYIKMRLAAIDLAKEDLEAKANLVEAQAEWRLEKIAELDDDETVKSLCAYYLSQVIARSQQWAIQNRPEIFANRSVRWSVNLGVPVEYCDSIALKTFEKVLAIAWLLKSTDIDTSALTIDSLNRLTKHLEQWASTDEQINQLDCTTTPEIVAAMWSFINSRQAQEGFYTFFDIGDGTLDGAAFLFDRTDGSRQVDCYIGKVEPLGVSAFVEKTADELQLTPESIRHSLSNLSDSPLNDQLQNSSTRNKIQRMVAAVVMAGNEKHQKIRQFSVKKDIGENLKVFIGGGGGNTEFFPDTIESTHSDFRQGNADIPPYKLRQIPTPEDLTVNGLDQRDFNRFAIAYGLCIPEGENPEIRLPSQFQTIESGAEISNYTPERYEDSRDLM
ncbi:hypothetical protein [cf. Phormidesmis sp. LEGE 11477]|uniref:hypothetical protein n=1 Tax=cf. Phormidesmis sp. LEGE 11477 TaxID=1828680 RepID=UPI001882531B|nr:hypothetical protein [cf. Phormidesmis sp. LEGE 11477]MBE9064351.1 hypothetical protein [cf. Phormidesmis sp. LEGE 11477]